MRFSAGKTPGTEYSWWLYGGDGELVAWAGETFPSDLNARRAAGAFRVGARPRYEVYEARANVRGNPHGATGP